MQGTRKTPGSAHAPAVEATFVPQKIKHFSSVLATLQENLQNDPAKIDLFSMGSIVFFSLSPALNTNMA